MINSMFRSKKRMFFGSLFVGILVCLILAAAAPSVVWALAPTKVYYSVGQSTSDLKSGTPTVTITGGTAVFSTGQSGNIGVGDRLTYNTNQIAYLVSKNSASSWNVVTATGTIPGDVTAVTVNSIKHEFTTLAAAITGAKDVNHLNTTDLVSGNYQLNLACYYDSGPDTSAVSISGYTTGAANYLKIYTPTGTPEANYNQRHSGMANTGYYLHKAQGLIAQLDIQVNHVWVEGIAVKGYPNSQTVVIQGLAGTAASEVKLSHNYFWNNGDSGITVYAPAQVKIWNNMIRDTVGNGIYLPTFAGAYNAYLYNNTIVNTSGTGLFLANIDNSGSHSLKNNLVSGSSTADYNFTGVTLDASANNLSRDATSPDAAYRNKIAVFGNSANHDFHLAGSDTVAKNMGVDLSADPDLAFNTDIDGQTRPGLGAWDIGADEGAVAIYRSLAPGDSSDHNTGNRTVGIAGTTATFSGPLPNNVGVGDVLQYQSGATYYLAFISGRTSDAVFTVQDVNGGIPQAAAPGTTVKLYRAYTSLANALAGTENTALNAAVRNFDTWSSGKNLVTAYQQWNIVCYANGTTGDVITGSYYIGNGNWVTGEGNYLRIYTPYTPQEVGVSQRHTGKWDQTKFYLNNTSSIQYAALTVFNSNYIRIDGMQVVKNGSAGSSSGINIDAGVRRGQIYFSNNFITSQTGTKFANGIATGGSATAYLYNNIVMNSAASGIHVGSNTNATVYCYNNTIVNVAAYNGIRNHSGTTLIAKNNIVQNAPADLDYVGGFSASDYNLSSDNGNTGGVHDKLNTQVAFVDQAKGDYHLAPQDTAAKAAGLNLAADANLAFNTDIDGQVRVSWDIGADEGRTEVFYSVGQSTADLKSGAPTITIADGEAVFDLPQTGNIGVGDRVTYAGNTIAYIAAKTNADQRHWTVVTATGGVPADIAGAAVVSINHEFNSLAAAIASSSDADHLNNTDLTAANAVLNIACYFDSGPDNTRVTVGGYTTSPTNYIKIFTPANTSTEANFSQRHTGKYAADKYSLEGGTWSSALLEVTANNVILDGLQLYFSSPDAQSTLAIAGDQVTVQNCLIRNRGKGVGTYQNAAVYIGAGNITTYLYNNLIYDAVRGINWTYTSGNVTYAYNNTVTECTFGFLREGGSMVLVLKNNLANRNTTDYSGSFDAASTNNISADLTSPNASYRSQTVTFVDAGGQDFHLAPNDSTARTAGVDLSADLGLAFNTDMDGQMRVSPWDIGADKAAIAAYASPIGGTYAAGQLVSLTGSATGTIYYTVDGSEPTTGSSVFGSAILVDTNTTLKFFIVDALGESSVITTENYIIDTTAPTVAISTPTAGAANVTTPVLSYTVSDGTVVVKVDGLPVAKVSGDSLDALADGSHTVRVEATDDAGNVGYAEVAFTVDTSAPTVAITTPAAAQTNDATPLLTYTVSDGTVAVQVDGSTVAKVSGDSLDELAPGTHTVRVEATDTAGNMGFAELAFTVKVDAPVIVITAPAGGVTNDTTPLLTYTVSEGAAVVIVDGTTVAKVSGDSLDTLAEGTHTVRVEATDTAGNLGYAEVNFTIDTTVPTVTATPAGGSYNSVQYIGLSADEAAVIYFTTDGTLPTVASSVYNRPFAIAQTTILKYFAIDTAGNSSQPQEQTYIIDNIAPSLTVNPVTTPTGSSTQLITGTTDADCTVEVVSDTPASDGEAVVTAGNWSYELTNLAVGLNRITITATDILGNTATTVTAIVYNPEALNIPVSGVSLNKESATIYPGDTEVLTALVTPWNATNKTIIWRTTNPTVAAVENGVVRGIAPGTAYVTVNTVDGNFAATCLVTVVSVPTGEDDDDVDDTDDDSDDDDYSRDAGQKVRIKAAFDDLKDAQVKALTQDVSPVHWGYNSIQEAVRTKLFQGSSKGFEPDRQITRLEFVVALLNSLDTSGLIARPTEYRDQQKIPSWAWQKVQIASTLGLITGYPDGTFRPEGQITRAEAAVIIDRLMAVTELAQGEPVGLECRDQVPLWAQQAINRGTGFGLFNGYPDGKFGPERAISRAEVAVVLVKIITVRENQLRPGGRYYNVLPGDTSLGIAASFHTTVAELGAANRNFDPDNLRPGQIIYIPASRRD